MYEPCWLQVGKKLRVCSQRNRLKFLSGRRITMERLGCGNNVVLKQIWFKSEIVFAAECFWLPERIKIKEAKTFTPSSECPVITKDLAVWVPSQTLGEEVRQTFVKCLKKLVKNPVQVRSVRIVDVFEDTSSDTTRKSFCFSLVFGSDRGTLTDEMVNPIFDALQDQLENHHHYQLRKQIL